MLRFELKIAKAWIAELQGNGIRTWTELEVHFAWLRTALERRPPVPRELALALGMQPPPLYPKRLEVALDAAHVTPRPTAVLAALRGRSEESVKQHRYVRTTLRVPVVRFRPINAGRRRLIVREELDSDGHPVSVLLEVEEA